MTVALRDLFDLEVLDRMVAGGFVRVQTHPVEPLCIANYTEKAQFAHEWNEVTLNCRGLIYHAETGEVVARPYRKFFNYGDVANTGPLDLTAPVIVTDKLDGSLGISYSTRSGPAVATRGSFTSEQAVHATELLRSKYPDWRPMEGFTYLWEIVYPQNRIVVDYGQTDDLILHGLVSIDDGKLAAALRGDWPGPHAEQFNFYTLAEALAAEPRPNAEGMVVRYRNDLMVKIKQQDYVRLHRIITGLNARTVWEWLGEGKTVGDLCATLPDDFHAWVSDIWAELSGESARLMIDAREAHLDIVTHLDEADRAWSRRDYAQLANENTDLRPYLFLLLDGKDEQARQLAWRAVKPSGDRTLVNHGEAVA